MSLDAGTWRFTATADDGVRLYVDGQLKIDAWIDQAPKSYSADVALAAGSHSVVMEYYENAGGAVASLAWTKVGGGATASKLSLHSGGGSLSMQFVSDTQPPVVKLLDNLSAAAEIKQRSPGTRIIARIFEASQPHGRRSRPASAGVVESQPRQDPGRPGRGLLGRLQRAGRRRARAGPVVRAVRGGAGEHPGPERQEGLHRQLLDRHARRQRPRDLARLLPGDRRCHGPRRHPGPPRVRHAHAAVLRGRRGERPGVAVRPVPARLPGLPHPQQPCHPPRRHRDRRRRRLPGVAKLLQRGPVPGPARVVRRRPAAGRLRDGGDHLPAGDPGLVCLRHLAPHGRAHPVRAEPAGCASRQSATHGADRGLADLRGGPLGRAVRRLRLYRSRRGRPQLRLELRGRVAGIGGAGLAHLRHERVLHGDAHRR